MWMQIVGKVRIALEPWQPHAWHATLHPNARGLTTGLIPGPGGGLEVAFDFHEHALIVMAAHGEERLVDLTTRSVADFHAEVIEALAALGLPVDLHARPNEVADPVPFAAQTDPVPYDRDAAHDFWRAVLAVAAVFGKFRTAFLGKSTPPMFYWGSFDLAVTRFSGRPAPRHPGGIAALPDQITRDAYSHECASAGFWPGDSGIDQPMFYACAWPEPPGYGRGRVLPRGAEYQPDLGEFLLPYDAVRTAPDPESTLLDFLQTTYEAAANTGRWTRTALECPIGHPRRPRPA